MHFTKMEGLGNDYLYILGGVPENVSALSVRLSDRHFGPGADGLVFIGPSEKADFSMRIFNADGSEASMCGNGIRCVGKYVYERGLTDKTELLIETGAGLRRLRLHTEDVTVDAVTVEMGKAVVASRADGGFFVDVGNPHLVLFVNDAENAPLSTLGPQLSGSVPGGINVELVQVMGEAKLRMRVWERGSGITLACGTGACASVAAAVFSGVCQAEQPIEVCLDGGSLWVTAGKDGTILMTGPARTVYEGEAAL